MAVDYLPLHSSVFSGPSNPLEIAVAGSDSRELGICRQPVVGVMSFLFEALHAQCVRVEAAHREASVEGCAATVAVGLGEERVSHFLFLPWFVEPGIGLHAVQYFKVRLSPREWIAMMQRSQR